MSDIRSRTNSADVATELKESPNKELKNTEPEVEMKRKEEFDDCLLDTDHCFPAILARDPARLPVFLKEDDFFEKALQLLKRDEFLRSDNFVEKAFLFLHEKEEFIGNDKEQCYNYYEINKDGSCPALLGSADVATEVKESPNKELKNTEPEVKMKRKEEFDDCAIDTDQCFPAILARDPAKLPVFLKEDDFFEKALQLLNRDEFLRSDNFVEKAFLFLQQKEGIKNYEQCYNYSEINDDGSCSAILGRDPDEYAVFPDDHFFEKQEEEEFKESDKEEWSNDYFKMNDDSSLPAILGSDPYESPVSQDDDMSKKALPWLERNESSESEFLHPFETPLKNSIKGDMIYPQWDILNL